MSFRSNEMDQMYSYDYQFRLIVVGDSTVGKVDLTIHLFCVIFLSFFLFLCQSSLLRTFCDGVFSQDPVRSFYMMIRLDVSILLRIQLLVLILMFELLKLNLVLK